MATPSAPSGPSNNAFDLLRVPHVGLARRGSRDQADPTSTDSAKRGVRAWAHEELEVTDSNIKRCKHCRHKASINISHVKEHLVKCRDFLRTDRAAEVAAATKDKQLLAALAAMCAAAATAANAPPPPLLSAA